MSLHDTFITQSHGEVCVAARHKLPAVYFERNFVASGGLISYGPDILDRYRRSASYVDRILKGESRPACRCRHRPSLSW